MHPKYSPTDQLRAHNQANITLAMALMTRGLAPDNIELALQLIAENGTCEILAALLRQDYKAVIEAAKKHTNYE